MVHVTLTFTIFLHSYFHKKQTTYPEDKENRRFCKDVFDNSGFGATRTAASSEGQKKKKVKRRVSYLIRPMLLILVVPC